MLPISCHPPVLWCLLADSEELHLNLREFIQHPGTPHRLTSPSLNHIERHEYTYFHNEPVSPGWRTATSDAEGARNRTGSRMRFRFLSVGSGQFSGRAHR